MSQGYIQFLQADVVQAVLVAESITQVQGREVRHPRVPTKSPGSLKLRPLSQDPFKVACTGHPNLAAANWAIVAWIL